MAYILGFIYADGNLTKNKRGGHYLSIYTADRELLIKMREILKSNHKISNRKSISGFNYCIQIGSKEIFADLVEIGARPNKTLRMKLPKIPNKYFADFLRGYFDGDGNVWVGELHKNRSKNTLTIQVCFTSCSKQFLESLLSGVRSFGVMGGSINKVKNKACFRLGFSVNDALKIYKIMYNSHQSQLFLNRKKATFEKFIKTKKLRV